MAVGTRAKKELAELDKRVPLLASAVQVQLNNPSWKNFSMIDQSWQRACWDYYRLIGAFHYGSNWIGSACSRAEIYVADVNELGVVGARTDNPEVAAIADTLFGGPTTKAEIINNIAVSITVAGECYVIGQGKAGSGKDAWTVVAPYMVAPYKGGIWVGQGTAYSEKIPDGSAIVIRVWKQRSDQPWYADSVGMAALQTLRELEQLYKFKAAQTDSRLANAGIYPIPAGLDFTYDDSTPPGAPSIQRALVDAANASLEGKGSAASLSPIFFEVDADILPHMFKEPIKFGSVMSDQLRDLEEMALQQLAITMSLPPEIILGTGQSNQWSAWEVGESAVKYHVEPLLNLIIEALNTSYLAPALKRLGKDPSRYTFQADTSALTVRPNRFADALNAYNVDALSAEALRFYGDFKESDAPGEEEITQKKVQAMLLRDPQLVMDPHIVDASGLEIEVSLPVEGVTPPPPVPGRVPVEGKQPMPARPSETVTDVPGIIASHLGQPTALLAAASAEVHNALRLAGNRLKTPQVRKEFPDTEPHMLHTKLRVDEGQAAELMAGAFGALPDAVAGTGVDPVQLRALLAAYTRSLLCRSAGHDRNLLASVLEDHGLAAWQS